jgi:hypothetical protein
MNYKFSFFVLCAVLLVLYLSSFRQKIISYVDLKIAILDKNQISAKNVANNPILPRISAGKMSAASTVIALPTTNFYSTSSNRIDFSQHKLPIVIATCRGAPGFKMSLPNYSHLQHWIQQAISNQEIDIGNDYIRYQTMFSNNKFSRAAIMIDVGCNHGLAGTTLSFFDIKN